MSAKTCLYVDIYALNLFIEHSGEHWWEQICFCSFTTSILAKLSTWCFEHSGDISCSLLVHPSHTDESWAGRNTCMWIIYVYIYIYICLYTDIYIYTNIQIYTQMLMNTLSLANLLRAVADAFRPLRTSLSFKLYGTSERSTS